MKLLLLALLALASTGCCFRESPTVMYRDGWGGTAVVVPSPCNPIPYAASMPAQPAPGVTAPQPPAELVSGWYVGSDNQWRPQRWVRLGSPDTTTPAYVAVYP